MVQSTFSGFERLHDACGMACRLFIGKVEIPGIAFVSPANERAETSCNTAKISKNASSRLLANRENFFPWLRASMKLKKRGINFEFQDHEICRHSIISAIPTATTREITTYVAISAAHPSLFVMVRVIAAKARFVVGASASPALPGNRIGCPQFGVRYGDAARGSFSYFFSAATGTRFLRPALGGGGGGAIQLRIGKDHR